MTLPGDRCRYFNQWNYLKMIWNRNDNKCFLLDDCYILVDRFRDKTLDGVPARLRGIDFRDSRLALMEVDSQ
jgi:hypothetical protein